MEFDGKPLDPTSRLLREAFEDFVFRSLAVYFEEIDRALGLLHNGFNSDRLDLQRVYGFLFERRRPGVHSKKRAQAPHSGAGSNCQPQRCHIPTPITSYIGRQQAKVVGVWFVRCNLGTRPQGGCQNTEGPYVSANIDYCRRLRQEPPWSSIDLLLNHLAEDVQVHGSWTYYEP